MRHLPKNDGIGIRFGMDRRGGSYRKIGVRPPSQAGSINKHTDIRANDRGVPRKGRDCSKEIPEKDRYAVELDAEAQERPSQENEPKAGEEGCCTLGLLPPREEDKSLGRSDDYRQADQEEDLWLVSRSQSAAL